jgi:hypothetical protein
MVERTLFSEAYSGSRYRQSPHGGVIPLTARPTARNPLTVQDYSRFKPCEWYMVDRCASNHHRRGELRVGRDKDKTRLN